MRALIVYIFLGLKDFALIEHDELTDGNVAYDISEYLDGLVIGKRIREYTYGKKIDVSQIKDEDLVFLSKIDDMDSPFNDFYNFKKFLIENLENCESYADNKNLYIDQAQIIIERMKMEQEKQTKHVPQNTPKENKKNKVSSIFIKSFRSIFKSPEVQLTIKEIKKTINECKEHISDMLLGDIVLVEVKRISINHVNNKETVDAISLRHVHPRDLAMIYVARASANLVTSGNYHIYRGLLRDEGKYLLKVVRYLLDQLQESGHISHEDSMQFEADMQHGIKRAG